MLGKGLPSSPEAPLFPFQAYGFPVSQLFDLLLEIQDQYRETLLKKWAGAFR